MHFHSKQWTLPGKYAYNFKKSVYLLYFSHFGYFDYRADEDATQGDLIIDLFFC